MHLSTIGQKVKGWVRVRVGEKHRFACWYYCTFYASAVRPQLPEALYFWPVHPSVRVYMCTHLLGWRHSATGLPSTSGIVFVTMSLDTDRLCCYVMCWRCCHRQSTRISSQTQTSYCSLLRRHRTPTPPHYSSWLHARRTPAWNSGCLQGDRWPLVWNWRNREIRVGAGIQWVASRPGKHTISEKFR